jgi:hypothetical protein
MQGGYITNNKYSNNKNWPFLLRFINSERAKDSIEREKSLQGG